MLQSRSAFWNSILRDTLAVIMAGGEGNRLRELTRSESKPALPIAGHYRNIDFSLSNCVNSGIRRIGLLTQYKAHSLIQHVQSRWNLLRPELGECLELWPAQQRAGKEWYQGTADAVRQNLDIIEDHNPQYVIILAGDHIYAMDYLPMLEAHRRSGADVTIGCVKVPLREARSFGVLTTDGTGRVIEFQEKPQNPIGASAHPDHALGSMGIYVFDLPRLRTALRIDAQTPHSQHDFGRDVIPALVETGHVHAYEFVHRETGEPGYWRDVGTLDSYWQANMELLEDPPPIDLYDESWPILAGRCQCAPAKVGANGTISDSVIGAGCQIYGTVKHSVLSENAEVHRGAFVENAVILPGAIIGRNSSILNAIIDSRCRVPDGTLIGHLPYTHRGQTEPGNDIELVTTRTLTDPDITIETRRYIA